MPTVGETPGRGIRTPDQRLRVFVSSTLAELADERGAVRRAVEQLRLAPVMFELGARPHPPRELYRSYLEQSDIFVGIYWQQYGWIAPEMDVSGLEDEYRLAADLPRLVYVKRPAGDADPRLARMLREMRDEGSLSYKPFSDPDELQALVLDDLTVLLAERFDAGRRLPAVRSDPGVPAATSSFVGREQLLEQLRGRLSDDGERLLTLTGPGGIGKTRLALEACRGLSTRFTDGVVFVDLGDEHLPADVLPAILRTLGATSAAEEPPLEALRRHLQGRRTLLVLDNMEHLTAAGPDLVRLLERCPTVSALVTSREALRVRGERVVTVPALGLPPAPAAGRSMREIEQSDAVRLFVDRASAAAPSFALGAESLAAVADICARLDGLPLAIELAAARVPLLGAEALRARLADRLETLGRGPRDLPERQQTLRRTVEWSMELLDEADRKVLLLLSVSGDARLVDLEEAARQVPALASVDVSDCVRSLLDKSLVQVDHGGGGPRVHLLNTVRAYAVEQLDEDAPLAAAARRALAERYVERAQELRARSRSADPARTAQEISSELVNLRAAWAHWSAESDVDRLRTLFDVMWEHFETRGDYRSAVHLGEQLLATLSAGASPREHVAVQQLEMDLARARLAVLGLSSEAERAIGSALSHGSALDDPERRFASLRSLASLHMLRSDFAGSARAAAEMMVMAQERQDPVQLFHSHLLTGVSAAWSDTLDVALRHVETALVHLERTPAERVQARVGPHPAIVAHAVAALLDWMTGRTDRATVRMARALSDAESLGHPYSLAFALHHSALLSLWRDDADAVIATTARLLGIADDHGYEVWRALGLVVGAAAKVATGDVAAGIAESEEGLRRYGPLATPPVFGPSLLVIRAATLLRAERVDAALAALDDAERERAAADVLGRADAAIVRADALLSLPEPEISAARAYCAEAAAVAHERGARMTELAALTRLVRCGTGAADSAGDSAADRRRLHALVGTFTEGLSSPHMVAARAVLDGE